MHIPCIYIVILQIALAAKSDGADPIQAFVIPHSHMDVGWGYTVQVQSQCMLVRRQLFKSVSSLHTENVTFNMKPSVVIEDQISDLIRQQFILTKA